jgi:hypothetical protein
MFCPVPRHFGSLPRTWTLQVSILCHTNVTQSHYTVHTNCTQPTHSTNLDPSGSAAQHTGAWAAFMPPPPLFLPSNRPQIKKLPLPAHSSRPSTASFSGWEGGGVGGREGGGGSSSEFSMSSSIETPRGATQGKPFVQYTPRRGERERVSSLTVGEVTVC